MENHGSNGHLLFNKRQLREERREGGIVFLVIPGQTGSDWIRLTQTNPGKSPPEKCQTPNPTRGRKGTEIYLWKGLNTFEIRVKRRVHRRSRRKRSWPFVYRVDRIFGEWIIFLNLGWLRMTSVWELMGYWVCELLMISKLGVKSSHNRPKPHFAEELWFWNRPRRAQWDDLEWGF